jgi:hypothetical protein
MFHGFDVGIFIFLTGIVVENTSINIGFEI